MTAGDALALILQGQRAWAARRAAKVDHDYCRTLQDNLFQPLHPATLAEFSAADGSELGRKGSPGKMQSIRSSSALAVNVFDSWRTGSVSAVADALGLAGAFESLRFEQKFPHGLASKPPNVDLVLYRRGGSPVGIECKFAEPYGSHSAHKPLADKYFPRDRARWGELGLPHVQDLAEHIGRDLRFQRLGAGQLVKHVLGLANVHRDVRPVRLIYLWYDTDTSEAAEHRAEVESFSGHLGDDVEFWSLTYQEVWPRLIATSPAADYVEYLQDRYFGTG